jgi:hypothetical protein
VVPWSLIAGGTLSFPVSLFLVTYVPQGILLTVLAALTVALASLTIIDRPSPRPLNHRLSVGRRSSQRCVECSNQLPDKSATRWCARVAPQDVHNDGRCKHPRLRDLVESARRLRL